MAQTDRFMIAPLLGGTQTNRRPWIIPDDAFESMKNAYIYRGRIKKRFGTHFLNQTVASNVAQLNSRLRVFLQNYVANPTVGMVPGIKFEVGQMFSVGDVMLTVVTLGVTQAMKSTDATVTGTYDTTNGAYSVSGIGIVVGTPIYFYPATPVMGFITYDQDKLDEEPVFAFDTQFAYQYINGAWERLSAESALGAATWSGTNSQLFWGYSYLGLTQSTYALFVTNFFDNVVGFAAAEKMRYWDGTQWNFFSPVINNAGDTVVTARIIVPFQGRLILLNTVEKVSGTNVQYVSRVRWSQNGSAISSNAWNQDIPGRGNAFDAPTREQIITAQFLKNRLIVYFESSTWELAFTGNEINPFRWQQINTELGAESTFSEIPFDTNVYGIGSTGIHACNGSNVQRIDQKIPDQVWEISDNNQSVYRVYGIRDYFSQLVYWTFPSEDSTKIFTDRILVYNYITDSWAMFFDTITAFGYIQPLTTTTEKTIKQVVAGNQEGFTFLIDTEETRNAPSMQITNITYVGTAVTVTAINHNLSVLDFIVIENALGVISLNDTVFQVVSVTSNTFTITAASVPTGIYTGRGTVAIVSRIDILTKQYNFYVSQGVNSLINKVDFYVDKTTSGQFTVDWFVGASTVGTLSGGTSTGALIGNGVITTAPYSSTLAPAEQNQVRIWHPIYPMADGECIQLRIYLSDVQMLSSVIAWSKFEIHAMTFFTQKTSSRLQ